MIESLSFKITGNRELYGRYKIGPFDQGQAITIGNGLRRIMMSDVPGIAITSVQFFTTEDLDEDRVPKNEVGTRGAQTRWPPSSSTSGLDPSITSSSTTSISSTLPEEILGPREPRSARSKAADQSGGDQFPRFARSDAPLPDKGVGTTNAQARHSPKSQMLHEFSSIPGVRESVLELFLNLKEIVFSDSVSNTEVPAALGYPAPGSNSSTGHCASLPRVNDGALLDLAERDEMLVVRDEGLAERGSQQWAPGSNAQARSASPSSSSPQRVSLARSPDSTDFITLIGETLTPNQLKKTTARLYVKGPAIITAKDIQLPPTIKVVDPNQYVASIVSPKTVLDLQLTIEKDKGYKVLPERSIRTAKPLIEKGSESLSQNSAEKDPDYGALLDRAERDGETLVEDDVQRFSRSEVMLGSRPEVNDEHFIQDSSSQASRRAISPQLPLDAVFVPIKKVNYIIEEYFQPESLRSDVLLNSDTKYSEHLSEGSRSRALASLKPQEQIIFEIWTNGSIHPLDAISSGVKILINLLKPLQTLKRSQPKKQKPEPNNFLIEELDLSVRSYNGLKRAGINNLSDLAGYSKKRLQNIKNLGKKSVEEIIEVLKNRFGIQIPNI